MRLTRTGASSSARAAVNGGSTAVAADDDPEVAPDPAAAGAAHQQQRAAGSHPADGMPGDLERQHRVVADRLAHLIGVHLQQGPVVRAAGGDQHVVDRARQLVEESLQRRRVVRVEGGGAAGRRRRARPVEPIGIAAGEHDVGAFGAGPAGGFQPDSGAAADEDDGLSRAGRFALEPIEAWWVVWCSSDTARHLRVHRA